MRSWWAEGSRQHIAPSGRRWEDWSLHGASIDHRVPGARAVRGTAARAPPQRAAGGGAEHAPMRQTDHGAAGRASTGPGPRPGVGRQAMVAWAVRRGHDISALCVFERLRVQAPERASANSGPVVTSTRDAGPRSEPVATSATRRAA